MLEDTLGKAPGSRARSFCHLQCAMLRLPFFSALLRLTLSVGLPAPKLREGRPAPVMGGQTSSVTRSVLAFETLPGWALIWDFPAATFQQPFAY